MPYGAWIVTVVGLSLFTWMVYMVARALTTSFPPYGLGGYGRGSEADKRSRGRVS
jgi:hypothetical protein